MPLENHEKARFLLHRSLVEEISLEDRHWLDAHVGQCAECGRYADLSARAVRALDWFALELDPAAALRVDWSVSVTHRFLRRGIVLLTPN
jgi:hypothetical protein